jgi:outer membrane cobalamin receptor
MSDHDRTSFSAFHLMVGTEMRPVAPGAACTLEAIVMTTSQMRATQLMRAADVGGVSAREIERVDPHKIAELPILEPDVVLSRDGGPGSAWHRR